MVWFVLTFSRQCYNITGLIYLVVCWPQLSLNYSIVYSLTIVGRLYYTVWSTSAVGNGHCSLKKYIYCVIYYNFRHTFVPYSRLWPDGVVKSAHYCRRFGDLFRWFLHLRLNVQPYFYCRFVWPTDLESIPHASTPTSIIPTKFEVDITIHCQVVAFLSAHTSRDLVTLTFDLEQLTCMAGHVTNLATKFEHPMPIRSYEL